MDDKFDAAMAWIVAGESEAASRLCGVPGRTIRYWMEQSWWEGVVEQVRQVKQKELDARWTGLIHKAANEINDRLDNGDEILDKNGNKKYIKIKAKDLAFILNVVVDKRALQRGEPTSRSEKKTTTEHLDDVAKRLEQFDDKPTEPEPAIKH